MVILPSAAQNKPVEYQVSGQIIEKKTGAGIPFATVVLKNDSLKINKMMACDGSGNFSIKLSSASEYTLAISAVGFRDVIMPVGITEIKTSLGKISVEEGTEIKAVTVTAQKPLVKIEVDKLVYNIEADPEAQTNSALEMLAKVPLVTVDAEENVTLNGQSNFKVLINGKSSTMLSANLKDVLKSMPANSIRDIEVITNPSSKYDAEGVGGIINIITSRKTFSGYNGRLSAGIDSRGSLNGSIYTAIKIRKLSFSGYYYDSEYTTAGSEYVNNREYYDNADFHFSNSQGHGVYKGVSNGFSGEASYEIDSLNLLSMSFRGNYGNHLGDNFNEIRFLNTSNDITRRYISIADNQNTSGSLSGNIDYQKTYKKPDKSLTFSYKLDNNPSSVNNISLVSGMVNYPSYCQRSENEARGREQTFQADYYDPLSNLHQIEGGVKIIVRQNTSNSTTWRDSIDLNTGNELDYDQYILGLYAGYLIKWKNFSTKTGLRMERTWNDGVSVNYNTSTDFTNRLFNLVPYITLSYMPKPGKTFRLSYTQRLYRPGIYYMNPYVNNQDSMNISYGNPSLVSEISHSFELSYSWFSPKFNFSATSYAALTNNSIERISRVQANGSTISTYENIGTDEYLALNLYFNYRPVPQFNVYSYVNISYRKVAANTEYEILNEGFGYRGMLGSRLTLWKNSALNIYGNISSSNILLQGKSSGSYNTSLSLSQYILKRKLMLSCTASDPFWKRKTTTSDTEDITFCSHLENSSLSRVFRFSLSYNFGKTNLEVQKARRGIKNDDLKTGGQSTE